MTSAVYAALSAFLMTWLSLNVIKTRRRLKIKYGDDGNHELQIARAAHSNAVEYIPIALILLLALEYNGATLWLVHGLGVALLIGRLLHARGILSETLPLRVLGMQITLFTIIGLATLNLVYFFGKV